MITGDDPAFPLEYEIENQIGLKEKRYTKGLTIRQEFAKSAMRGLIASCDWNETAITPDQIKSTAEFSVQYADALIQALNVDKK